MSGLLKTLSFLKERRWVKEPFNINVFKKRREIMGKMSQADFFFGAALSVLFNNNMVPVLVENGSDRRIYDVTTNDGDFRLYMKYRKKPSTDNEFLTSWQFIFSQEEIEEFKNKCKENIRLILICGKENLKNSEFAVLYNSEIKEAICDSEKNSITIGRKKHARNFYISMRGGRKNDLHITANRLDIANLDVV